MSVKHILAVLMSVCLLATALPIGAVAEEATPAPQAALPSIEEQVRAYAKSIDQKGADEAAAWALATHGVTGRGKKLAVGEKESLTAMLMNAGMTIAAVTDGCRMGIQTLQRIPTLSSVFVDGGSRWSDQSMFYTNNAYIDDQIRATDRLDASGTVYFTDANAYDASMIWIAGTMGISQYFSRGAATKDTITYHVTIIFEDRFDFSTGNASVSKELASVLGSAMFHEFDWNATVRFTLTVPNPCDHTGDAYHFSFDAEQEGFTADATAPFASNVVNRIDWYNTNNIRCPYYQLDETVILYHDMPWVMEYTVYDPNQMIFGTTPVMNASTLHLLHTKHIRLVFAETFTDAQGKLLNRWMGIPLNLPNIETNIYTVRLENCINPDGSNMVYASVYNETTQSVAISHTPMNNVYIVERGVIKESYSNRNDLSGKDLVLSCLGSRQYRFDPQMFDLKIWEAGTEPTGDEYTFTDAQAPTCTKDGTVTHTCRLCGYETTEKTGDKLGHDYGAWYGVKAPSCSAEGEERRDCRRCKGFESRPVAKTEHNLMQYGGQSPTCTEAGWKSYEACTDCDYTTYTTLPPMVHTYTATVTPPTCDKQGYTTYTCADCGDTYVSDHVAAAGHQYESVTAPPTCTTGGYTTHTCTLCGYTYEEFYSSANPHQYQCTVTPPTCGDTGYLVYTCVCGDQFTTAFGTATGRHTYDGDRDPDCNACGAVREVAAITLGDVTGDGKVNNRDLGLLQQYINGWSTAIDPVAADVTADGKVNNRDLGLLQQYINGWGVELG